MTVHLAAALTELGTVELSCVAPETQERWRLEFQLRGRLPHAGEIHAFRKRAHDLVEHVHDLRTRALELLDDAHASDEFLLVALEVVDLFDLLVDGLDLATQMVVAADLGIDHGVEHDVGGAGHDAGGHGCNAHGDREFDLALFAFFFAPRQ